MPSVHCVVLGSSLQASRHRGRKHKVLNAGSAHSVNAIHHSPTVEPASEDTHICRYEVLAPDKSRLLKPVPTNSLEQLIATPH
jgi:hypothetical protein